MNTSKNIDDFITNILDIDTCLTYGLDVWGRIVNISRYLIVDLDARLLGFVEAIGGSENYPTPFNDGVFYNDESLGKRSRLADSAYRKLIKCKMLKNISSATSIDINTILLELFSESGVCYCRDNGDMTIDLVFKYQPTPLDLAIITNANVIPTNAGVERFVKVEI